MASLGRSANISQMEAKRAERRVSGNTVPAATRAAQRECVCIEHPLLGIKVCCQRLLSYYLLSACLVGRSHQLTEVMGNAQVNEADTVLLPKGLKALKRVAKLTGFELQGAYLNLDGGFDSKANRKAIFNAGLIPNIKETPRNRKTPKRGRKRLFNKAIHALRERVERTFAWEDKYKRLLLRFEHFQRRHYGMKLMAYTLINF